MHSRSATAPGQQPDPTAFGHAIGAGIFRPYITPRGPDADLPLEAPLGLAFEVFAIDEAGNAAFHEDNFLLLEDRIEKLTVVEEVSTSTGSPPPVVPLGAHELKLAAESDS